MSKTVWPSTMKNTHIVKSAIKALQMGNNSVEKTNGLIYQRTIEKKTHTTEMNQLLLCHDNLM